MQGESLLAMSQPALAHLSAMALPAQARPDITPSCTFGNCRCALSFTTWMPGKSSRISQSWRQRSAQTLLAAQHPCLPIATPLTTSLLSTWMMRSPAVCLKISKKPRSSALNAHGYGSDMLPYLPHMALVPSATTNAHPARCAREKHPRMAPSVKASPVAKAPSLGTCPIHTSRSGAAGGHVGRRGTPWANNGSLGSANRTNDLEHSASLFAAFAGKRMHQ